MANITLNGVDLSTYGLVTPGVSGVHDLPAMEVSHTVIPGRDYPDETDQRLSMRRLVFACAVVGDDHADLVTKLAALKGYLSPTLGYCALTITDLTAKRIMARSQGFPVRMDAIPYWAESVEFSLEFSAYPWWEDATDQADLIASSPGTVDNGGDLVCYPTYTCTLSAVLAGGLYFEIQGKRFTYEGALAATDVLVVTTDPAAPDVTLNGTRDFANTADDAEYPELVTGTNTVVLSSASFTLNVSRRERYL